MLRDECLNLPGRTFIPAINLKEKRTRQTSVTVSHVFQPCAITTIEELFILIGCYDYDSQVWAKVSEKGKLYL